MTAKDRIFNLTKENKQLKSKLQVYESKRDYFSDSFAILADLFDLKNTTCEEIIKLVTDLKEQLKQRDEVIEETISFLKYGGIDSYTDSIENTHKFRDKVVNILQKYKGDNNERTND